MKNLLLVDIGGTHMRYAISKENENELNHINKLLLDTNTIDKHLIDIVNEHRIDVLIISAAGPKIGSTIEMTNRNYSFNSDEIKKRLNLKECYLINDWESIAHSYDFIKNDIISIKKGEQYNNNNLFLGPGTGLGSALLINDEVVVSTELGNTKNTISKFEDNYDVSNNSLNVLEDFISGSAISNIYKIKTDIELSSKEILKQNSILGIFLGYYERWDSLRNYEISKKNGFIDYEHDLEGCYFNFEKIDNYQHGIHDYFKYLKFGFARATDQLSYMINDHA